MGIISSSHSRCPLLIIVACGRAHPGWKHQVERQKPSISQYLLCYQRKDWQQQVSVFTNNNPKARNRHANKGLSLCTEKSCWDSGVDVAPFATLVENCPQREEWPRRHPLLVSFIMHFLIHFWVHWRLTSASRERALVPPMDFTSLICHL